MGTDVQMYRWILSNGFSPVIVATKADKIKRSQLQKQLKLLKDTLKVIEGVPIVPFSPEIQAISPILSTSPYVNNFLRL